MCAGVYVCLHVACVWARVCVWVQKPKAGVRGLSSSGPPYSLRQALWIEPRTHWQGLVIWGFPLCLLSAGGPHGYLQVYHHAHPALTWMLAIRTLLLRIDQQHLYLLNHHHTSYLPVHSLQKYTHMHVLEHVHEGQRTALWSWIFPFPLYLASRGGTEAVWFLRKWLLCTEPSHQPLPIFFWFIPRFTELCGLSCPQIVPQILIKTNFLREGQISGSVSGAPHGLRKVPHFQLFSGFWWSLEGECNCSQLRRL